MRPGQGGVIRRVDPKRRIAVRLVVLLGLGVSGSGLAWTHGIPATAPAEATENRPAHEDRVGVVLAPRRNAVLSAEVSGRVLAVNREFGESFDQGDALVQLKDTRYRVNKEIADATLTAVRNDVTRIRKLTDQQTRQRHADAVLAAAKANLVATQRLYENNHASQLDLVNARRDVAVAQSGRELAESTVTAELTNVQRDLVMAAGKAEIADDQVEACTIHGPWSGRVTRVLVNEQELVERGTPVIEVIDDRVLLAKFLLPSSVFGTVRLGQRLLLRVDEVAGEVAANVSHIAAALDAASVTFEVHATVDNADGVLRAGMNGSLSLSAITERSHDQHSRNHRRSVPGL